MSIKIGDNATLDVGVDGDAIDLVISEYGDGSFYMSLSIGREQVRALIALLKAALPTMDKAAELNARLDIIHNAGKDEQKILRDDQEFMHG